MAITQELLEGFEEDQDAGHVVDLELANMYLYTTHDIDKAYYYAEKEYLKRPQNIDVCKTMAAIQYKRNNLHEANKLIEIASRTNKQDAEILYLKGLINYKLGNEKVGVELTEKALGINLFINDDLLKEVSATMK